MKAFLGKIVTCLLAGFIATSAAVAGGEPTQPEAKSSGVTEKDWRIELNSGVLFSNVREDNNTETGYTLVPVNLTAGMRLDNPSGDNFLGGVLRGNTEFLLRADGNVVLHGPESRIIGLSAGPRYNFVQPGWKVVPFVEGTVGICFADSNPIILGTPGSPTAGQHGLGEDFNFMFGVAVGARYDVTDDMFIRLALDYVHISNAGLSEPRVANRPIDALGPEIGVGYGF